MPILGPLSGAEINAYRLSDLDTPITASIQAANSLTDLAVAGTFYLALEGIADEEWILVTATGGHDIDADDDGQLDTQPTTNQGTIHALALATAADWRAGGLKVNILTEMSWQYTRSLIGQVTDTELAIRMDQLAKLWIKQDINADGIIDWFDLLSFNPNDSAQQAKLNFNYQDLFAIKADSLSIISAVHQNNRDSLEKLLDIQFGTNLTQTPPSMPLNDTGITWGGNYPHGNNPDCSGTTINQQDCAHGRDVTHNDDSDGHAGFSFTKLDANGQDLAASATSWSCVRDNVTGLIWEVKTDDGGIHDKDNRYRWGGVTALGSGTAGIYYNDWDVLVNGSNTESLCSFSGWRVPTEDELLSLVDYSRINMAIESDYFPNNASDVWSSSPHAYGTNGAWAVHFDNGYADYNGRGNAFQVRLVRSGQ